MKHKMVVVLEVESSCEDATRVEKEVLFALNENYWRGAPFALIGCKEDGSAEHEAFLIGARKP